MVDDITSDSESTITESEYQKIHQIFEGFMDPFAFKCDVMILKERRSKSYWRNPTRRAVKYEKDTKICQWKLMTELFRRSLNVN